MMFQLKQPHGDNIPKLLEHPRGRNGHFIGKNLLVTYFNIILYMKLEAEGDSLSQILFCIIFCTFQFC